ncbi:MAG: hypothetical protein K1X78_27985, partial [Verrucomicrobiaceae bacterium]|nr:hypothetical protein [Verrucomicrobiaceae bacterium]
FEQRDGVTFELLVIGAFFRSCRVHADLGGYPTFAVHENEEGSFEVVAKPILLPPFSCRHGLE